MKDNIINSCKVAPENGDHFPKPLYSNEDIVCYKIIKRLDTGEAVSIYGHGYYPEVKEGSIIRGNHQAIYSNWFERKILRKPAIKKYIEEGITWNKEENWFDITFGFIHSLPHSYEGRMKEFMMIGDKGHYELWECVIPKETRYYQANRRGSHWESNNSYASKKLKFIKKLDEIYYKGWFNE